MQANFPLPKLSNRLEALRKDLIDGKGFFLFKGIPVREWDLRKCATAYMGLGTYLGYFTSQNGRGHVLGHVKDLGEDPTKTDGFAFTAPMLGMFQHRRVLIIIYMILTLQQPILPHGWF